LDLSLSADMSVLGFQI